MEISVEVHAEDGSYWADVPEFPGCLTSARTLEALAPMLEDAVRTWRGDPGLTLSEVRLAPGLNRVAVLAGDQGQDVSET